jgi:crotonobetainyl-CoA:carnitine CoA-transferase CaiB-like acyl-CoA transferase
LADFGATVVKIESPNHPDPYRSWAPAGGWPEGALTSRLSSPMFESNNAGKLGIALDLKTAQGQAEVQRLMAHADVVIENFRVGVTSRLGIDYEAVRKLNPELVYLSLSSQGQHGPEAAFGSYGSTLDLLSGLASVTGYPGGPPMWSSEDVNYPDQLVSLFGAALVTYCLAGGIRGIHLDVSQREVTTWSISEQIADFLAAGTVADRSGNDRGDSVPRDTYQCQGDDRWIAISCRTDDQRGRLASAIGLDAPASDSGWWRRNSTAVDEAITRWAASMPREDCVRILTAAEVPTAAVHDAADRFAMARFTERRVYFDGLTRMKGLPLTLGSYLPPIPEPAPLIGEHNDYLEQLAAGAVLQPANER